ncbi:hypothetical protein DUZ99_13005 [Xylanibacillus composti]|uniref:Uncharacterized protein n=1 Tax=Xylanibacillus composti TaxID=1572762 RepID=A0A8J4H5N6_9BACL|nr:hypothetical protein [Xylanibacillus composti]MDT9725892.1 hypothetical protein [Xylanibacillus composti]GIQ71279.1 hypothetical protein XYCOK13_41030 [Xylanibacillus composti]
MTKPRKRQLPIAEPPIQGFLHHAYTLTIGAHYPEFYPWFYSNYIQLRCYRDIPNNMHHDYLNFYNYDLAKDLFPWLTVEKISREVFAKGFGDIASFICECLDSDYYLYLFLDKYFLPERDEYQTRHFIHDHFIYGYDRDERLFDFIGFDTRGLFRRSPIAFEDLDSAFRHADPRHSWQSYLFIMKYNPNYRSALDLQLVIDLLDDYLQSRNTSERFRMYKQPIDAAFGMDVYNSLQEYFELLQEGRVRSDVRGVHIVHEHKKCMQARLQYMEREGFLNAADQLSEAYGEVVAQAHSMKLSLMKFARMENKDWIKSVMELIDQMKAAEKLVLEQVLDKLQAREARPVSVPAVP